MNSYVEPTFLKVELSNGVIITRYFKKRHSYEFIDNYINRMKKHMPIIKWHAYYLHYCDYVEQDLLNI